MIQSGKFDSSYMDIKKLANLSLIFLTNRLIEIIGIIISIFGFLLLISLITYSPSDPNFIFSDNIEVKNLLGFQGSYVSDFFLQSLGLISFLIPLTFLFSGINIFKQKKIFFLIENTFYIVVYSVVGALFFSYFYKDAFNLYINGNGGFVGTYFSQTLIKSGVIPYENVFYYIFLLLIILFFLLSFNFSLKKFFLFLKSFFNLIFKKDKQNYTNKNELINEYIPQDEIKNLIQEDLPFIKAEANQSLKRSKFKIPSTDLLKLPSKNETINSNSNEDNDPKFLEKILLDFGVNGNIKKVSHGPVVTLNEFEPAPGVKVSKIINLSDDIARNTSSVSTRVATIPGKNTICIEIPNSKRENVFLHDIIID